MQSRFEAAGRRCLAHSLSLLSLFLLLPARALAQAEPPGRVPYQEPEDLPSLDPDYLQQSHEVVVITDQALKPRRVNLEDGQFVAWISYSKVPTTVVFEQKVLKSMICHSLVNFSVIDGELRSAPIHTGEFASFCELKPGRYRYQVVRRDPRSGGAAAARHRLQGEIVVGTP